MGTEADPIVDSWYRHLDKGQTFRVVAVDEPAGAVEIEYFDGTVDEVTVDDWYRLEIEPCEAPEDWTGPMDDVGRDDLGYDDTGMKGADWHEPLEEQPALRPHGEEPEPETAPEGEGGEDSGETPPPYDEQGAGPRFPPRG